jgi:hypothetical protein
MYSLEYRMLVQVLRQLRYSGEFHADVPPQAALREGGQVVLHVQNGNVISCLILNRYGQKLYHDAETQRLLPALGILDWKLASSTSSRTANPVTPPAVPVAKPEQRNRQFIPRRLLVPEAQMRTWSTLERSVYFLADGTHSIEQIAMLLSRPPATIEQVIRNFQASGVIARS